MIEKEFVPYEEALALKELGFNEPCIAWFAETKKLQIAPETYKNWTSKPCDNSNIAKVFNNDCFTAPTYSQAFRWIREKYNFLHHINWVYKKTEGIQWFFDIKGINMTNNNILPHSETRFATHEEAELACLKKLIQLAK